MTIKHTLIAAALTGALTLTSAHAQTPDSVQTRIGRLSFERGYPTPDTARKLYDEMDFQRAVQAYLWSFPAVSFESIRIGSQRDLGADYNVMAIADNFVDSKGTWLTANDTTIYAVTNLDLGKFGPMVVDIPPCAIVGLIVDFWQRAMTDVSLPGPDGDKGASFSSCPPATQARCPRAVTTSCGRPRTITTSWFAAS